MHYQTQHGRLSVNAPSLALKDRGVYPAFWRVCSFCLVLLRFGANSLHGAQTNDFLARVYTNAATKTLPYRLLLPKDYDAAQSYPIILYLHGAAGRGDDNAEPLNWGPMLFLEPSLRDKHRFFLLVPQCPRNAGWVQSSLGGLNGYKE